MENYSLADIAAATGENCMGGNAWVMIILFALIFGIGGFGNNGRNSAADFGQFATAASQSEILLGQQFQGLDNKLDRLGNGIADATYELTRNITTEGRTMQNMLSDYQLRSQANTDALRYEMSRLACDLKSSGTENTQRILDVLSQNKIESLQSKVAELQGQLNMCGVVRYPMQTTYTTSCGNPFYGGCGCGSI